MLIRGWSPCLLLRQTRDLQCYVPSRSPRGENPYRNTRFQIVIVKRYFSQSLICIDKVVTFGIVNLTQTTKLSLFKGDGGWRKAFKSLSIQIRIFLLNLVPLLILDLILTLTQFF
jgi:hypothetical protein